jgi:phospholipid-translocating ATPase
VTIFKEWFDDIQRMRKDKELNNKKYLKLRRDGGFREISAATIKVGDIIKIHQNERVPADLILLSTTEKSGSVFIRTDQLDGETDWKLRKAPTMT